MDIEREFSSVSLTFRWVMAVWLVFPGSTGVGFKYYSAHQLYRHSFFRRFFLYWPAFLSPNFSPICCLKFSTSTLSLSLSLFFYYFDIDSTKSVMHSQSTKNRLALIRPAAQQLSVQNQQIESRSREGGKVESVRVQEESHVKQGK